MLYFFQAFQIANLIREYTEVLQSPPEIPKRDSEIVQQINQQHIVPATTTGNRKSRPASMLYRGAPVIHSQAS